VHDEYTPERRQAPSPVRNLRPAKLTLLTGAWVRRETENGVRSSNLFGRATRYSFANLVQPHSGWPGSLFRVLFTASDPDLGTVDLDHVDEGLEVGLAERN
jgi:hypothetical protein